MNLENFIQPDWPAPAHVCAYVTLRTGGVSLTPYDSFNLAAHVGDNPDHVKENRLRLKQALDLPTEPVWLQQTHSTIVLRASENNREKEADASYADQPNHVCAVLTGDCLPVLFCRQDGTQVAAVHAGWRGLANGIIEKTVQKLNDATSSKHPLLAWLGPAIGHHAYEIGDEVRDIFLMHDSNAAAAFHLSTQNRWFANLYELARLRLNQVGVTQIYGGNFCTYSDNTRFFSARRDGQKTGRMASLIWMLNLNKPVSVL